MRRLLVTVALLLLTAGVSLIGEQGWLTAKAALARVLIDRALAAHFRDGGAHRPWSWADVHPIARLEAPRLGVRRVVLTGATGASLAFGAGHVDGTAAPNGRGNCVLAGHRDGAFAFLGDLRVGDELILRSHDGVSRYVVREMIVADRSDVELLEPTDSGRLTLITCYPFGGLTRSNLRFAVVCSRRTPAA